MAFFWFPSKSDGAPIFSSVALVALPTGAFDDEPDIVNCGGGGGGGKGGGGLGWMGVPSDASDWEKRFERIPEVKPLSGCSGSLEEVSVTVLSCSSSDDDSSRVGRNG